MSHVISCYSVQAVFINTAHYNSHILSKHAPTGAVVMIYTSVQEV